MDFDLDETQQDLNKLAAEVLAGEGNEDRLRQAGLMSVCVPEEAGGAGLGPVEMAVVLREVGARAAPVPALATLVSTLALARHGTPDQQRRVTRATVALREPGRALAEPPTTAARRIGGPDGSASRGAVPSDAPGDAGGTPVPAGASDGGWALTGRKVSVPHLGGSALVAADAGLFLVEGIPDGSGGPGGPVRGVRAAPEFASTGEPAATLVFDDAPAERVGGPEAVDGTRRLFMAAVAAQASGVLAGALELTTSYIRTRRQFGRALAEFQAVTMQIADVYIAGRALDVAMWSAAWRLGEGLPADQDLALAAYHAGEAVKALHTCQHLHGGLGLDVTYPLHRHFAQAKHLSHLLGGAGAQLDLMGALV
ncbi:acyl-CoA dehydrogenase [Nonomuraea longispora]|uniref:Acyl-CoA dehydrogenase n=1 Tax=Nonomuraea longispora TaxID=1848320 RepID=A0A4R4N8H7_9ACTN|nr:acyl-CoA dehydrogenase family protein [Nonomuraea longispora]TDC05238.1 acyl-CoA dehydrogenase [Nonomuraea longispora]